VKVLLLGEFSAFHLNLSEGLKRQGIDVVLASNGDSFKGYKRDIEYPSSSFSLIQAIKQFEQWLNEYDIIQLINVRTLSYVNIIYLYIRSKLSMRAKIFCCTVGCDYIFWTEGRKQLKIPLFEEILNSGESKGRDSWRDFFLFHLINRSVNGFLGCYEYHDSYHKIEKRLPMVICPVNLSSISFEPIKILKHDKIKIYHGVQPRREGFKGSKHIIKAFEVANEIYSDQVECVAMDAVPYDEFLEIVRDFHVIFDQTNGHSYGMGALTAMAMGKVVGSNSQSDEFWNKWCIDLNLKEKPPLLSLLPDYKQILMQIKWIIDNKDKLTQISEKSRTFIEDYHDNQKVASLFLDRWENA
jgi:hypothetical protein